MESSRKLIFVHCLLVFLSVKLCAQSASEQSPFSPVDFYLQAQEVSRLMDENEHRQAETALIELVNVDPNNGSLWNLLAICRMHLGNYEAAIPAYQSAMSLGYYQPGAGEARLSRTYFALGNQETGFEWLKKCMSAGYRYKGAILRDTAFADLLKSDRFKTILDLQRIKYKSREEGWLADISQLVNEIKRVHYYYRNVELPSDFQDTIERLTNSLQDLSDSEVVIEIQKALALIGDGHTLIYPFGMNEGQLAHHPIITYMFSDGLFIIDGGKKYDDHIGKEVIKVGGKPVTEILENLKSYVSADNPSEFKWVAPMYLMFTNYLAASGATLSEKSLEITLRDEAGSESTIEVDISRKAFNPANAPVRLSENKLNNKTSPLSITRNNEAFWLKSYDQSKLMYTQINEIQNTKEESLSAFSLRLKDSLARTDSEYLVFDLRYNNGGNARFIPPLLKTAIWFESEKNGTIFVVMGRNTFSAAQTLLNRFERFTDATFLGEPSGSRPNRFGNEMQFRLNYSGLMGTIATGYNQGWTSRDRRIWIAPEIPVSLKSSDYFAGIDPVMEVIRQVVSLSNQ